MSKLIGKTGQSIFDVAFMCYGSYDVLRLMSENPFIEDLNYSDFAGKTISYTPVNNNATFVLGLENKIINTGIGVKNNYVWDGEFVLWDGTDKVIY